MKHKKIFMVILVTTLVSIFINGSLTAAEKIKINIGWQPAAYPAFYAARALNMFEKNGINANLVKFTAGPPMLAALEKGNLDIAVMGGPPFVYAVAEGMDVKIFLIDNYASKAEGLVVRPKSGIKSPKDQKGKTIGTVFGSSAHYALLVSLNKYNISESEVKIKDIAVPVIAPAFEKGDIDGAWIWAPWSLKLVELGGEMVVTGDEIGSITCGLWIGRTSWLKANPESVQRFIATFDMGRKYFIANPLEISNIISRDIGIKQETALTMMIQNDYLTMQEQIEGHKVSMGTSATKANAPLATAIKELSGFLLKIGRIRKKIDAAETIYPEAVEKYLKAKE